MAEKKKTIIDEALLDIKLIEEALMNNTKEILRSTMKEEIDNIVKESLNEADYDEEEIEDTDGEDLDVVDDEESIEEPEGEVDVDVDAEIDGDDDGIEDVEIDVEEPVSDVSDELPMVPSDGEDIDTMDMTAASDEEVISVFKKLNGEDEIEVVSDNEVKIMDSDSGNEYIVTLGGEQPSEMGGEFDDIDVDLDLDDTIDPDMDGDVDVDLDVDDDENIYEVTIIEDIVRGPGHDVKNGNKEVKNSAAPNTGDIDDQTAEKDKEITGDNLTGGFPEDEATTGDGHAKHIMEEELPDSSPESKPAEEKMAGHHDGHGDEIMNEEDIVEVDEEDGEEMDEHSQNSRGHRDVTQKTSRPDKGKNNPSGLSAADKARLGETVKKYNALLREAKKIKAENENFKKALGKFRTTLGETVVYNSNLTYVTKLFMEHSTTKEEKENIMARFDNEVSTVKESKKLYKTIKAELSNKKPVTESVDKKINSSVKSSSGNLNESTVYADPSTVAIRDLMNRVEGRL